MLFVLWRIGYAGISGGGDRRRAAMAIVKRNTHRIEPISDRGARRGNDGSEKA